MKILIAHTSVIPSPEYGGTTRVIWYLGKELVKMGHQVSYLVYKGSHCDFAPVIPLDKRKRISEQIPGSIDLVHFHFNPGEIIQKPHVCTMHGNTKDDGELNINTVFVSKNHANRFGSESFVHNGLGWEDYGEPDLVGTGDYFHFLGKAAWRVKNVRGAIDAIKLTKHETLAVLGGYRFNFVMGIRFTFSTRIKFYGMVGGEKKNQLIRQSRGLVYPVRWHEPFGLALIESLYLGCPVFGTPYGSLPEIVNKDVGFLTDSKAIMAKALENYTVFSRKTCHQYALDNFNSKKMAEKYLEKYTRVLDGEKLNPVPPRLLEVPKEKFLKWTT